MPTIPNVLNQEGKPKTMQGTPDQILNMIRSKSTPYFRQMVNEVDPENIQTLRNYGNVLLNNDGLMNEFLTALINRIGMVWISSKYYTNPWAFMKKGMMELGEVVEEIFVALSMPHLYNPQQAEITVFQREIPNVEAVFHKMNIQIFYKKTIQNDALRQAFVTWQGVTDLIARIVESMYASLAYDEFLLTKYLIAYAITNGDMGISKINTPTDEAGYRNAVSIIKSLSNLMVFMSNQYNAAGVDNYTDKADQYVIINSKFDASMAVEVLATSFNQDKADLMGRIVLVDDFSTFNMSRLNLILKNNPSLPMLTASQLEVLKNVPAVLIDRNWFMIFDVLLKMTDIYNNEGLYWNYTLHTWKIMSYSPFQNAVAFYNGDTEGTITGVSVNPQSSIASQGQTVLLNADVTGTGVFSKAVTWTSDNENAQVVMGRLTIPSNATGSITVTATSIFDPTKSGTATITVA